MTRIPFTGVVDDQLYALVDSLEVATLKGVGKFREHEPKAFSSRDVGVLAGGLA